MDNKTLKRHLIKQLIHHHEGTDTETLVKKTAESAGVDAAMHRTNIIDWLNWLTVTGHVKHDGDTLSPTDVRKMRAFHDLTEIERDESVARIDPTLVDFYYNDLNR